MLGFTYRITAESQNLLIPSISHLRDHTWRAEWSFGSSSARNMLTYWTEQAAESTTCKERLQELGLLNLTTEKSHGKAYWCLQLPDGEIKKSQSLQNCMIDLIK